MTSIELDAMPVTLADDHVDIRTTEAGEMTIGYFRLKEGTDLSPALVGLPGDLCQCPHWGYLLKGRLMMKTKDGDQVFEAGRAFYWAPGHAPVALEDCEYVDVSPTEELNTVIRHVKGE
ncbi:MAG: hypothetical protein LC722_01285 [Actinobacteria bacterium]|nr:hypothetical protein [Actinomycetota bacterium]